MTAAPIQRAVVERLSASRIGGPLGNGSTSSVGILPRAGYVPVAQRFGGAGGGAGTSTTGATGGPSSLTGQLLRCYNPAIQETNPYTPRGVTMNRTPPGALCVLVVDDDADARKTLCWMLSLLG